MITRDQCRAARALVQMSQVDLATAAGLSKQTVIDFERGARNPHKKNLMTIRTVLEAAGVEFIDPNGGGPGVRLRE
ncbi:helix-turn-helix transcriptional regulator [Hoeflea prorocentri]|uniref:Helix-turn-helix transcriptional regulator n=1 Tax=Hoeflea prorocentri TaxID=1922333 RepID=A0A9X3UEY3_9HYPH|nr:helix-turn-helix transcriptional regulator [Hoeflea prorocentri]MCY6379388.1 helix-turn-helix transcriptional regulator [Hoeflea prorocentri]MDA5397189.1 helix-turn-helix transcriptional regulator [Hoeflea prorocentri]